MHQIAYRDQNNYDEDASPEELQNTENTLS